jgi:hypothetical protein
VQNQATAWRPNRSSQEKSRPGTHIASLIKQPEFYRFERSLDIVKSETFCFISEILQGIFMAYKEAHLFRR